MDDQTRGRHLIITGFCPPSAVAQLDDEENIHALLTEAVAAVNMRVLVSPVITVVPLDEEKSSGPNDCGGITGFVVLSTSHASIHTWPLHGRFSFDLYSCKDFDSEAVIAVLKTRLQMCGGEVINLIRAPQPKLREHIHTIDL